MAAGRLVQHEVVGLALHKDISAMLPHPILIRGVITSSELANRIHRAP
jgi:hypothetical protein